MILNQYLPPEELQSTLPKEEFRNLEFILKNMLPPERRIRSIFDDPELLGKIHHSVNLEKYVDKKFRRELFDFSFSSISSTWERYFSNCGLIEKISEMTDSELTKNVKKLIEFEWGNNEETNRFIKFFDYPEYIIPDKSSEIPIEETIFGENAKFSPLKMLFGYQSLIVSKTLKHLENLNARCLIQMPTGTGKTRTAMELVTKILNEQQNSQIVWFANKSELLEQARDAFIHVWNHVGKYPVKVIAAWGNTAISDIPNENVIIFAGYQKMNNLLKMKKSLKPSHIIIDEAHQILAPTYNRALRNLVNFENSTRVIGLTATPGRGIDEQQNNLLVDEFHGNIIQIELDEEDKKEYGKNIVRYLEDQEILSRAIPDPLYTDFKYEITNEEWKELTKIIEGDHPEYTKDFLKNLANDNVRNMLIIDKLKEFAEQGKKILYFSTNIPQSILVFAALQQLGVKAIHVDGDTDRSFRRQIIQKFIHSNEISVICNFDIFSTGFDVPKLDVVVIGRPINSPVLLNQVIGRGTRGPKMGSESDSFILVQVIDKIHSRLSFQPYEQYGFWDKNWKQ